MAKYRPISPEQAWRSNRSALLDVLDRYGEYYFLTSPFSNAIGCYKIVERIAAAEIGLSLDDLTAMITRLSKQGVTDYEGGFLLVRTWFLHNTWESALQGNVAKAARANAAELPMSMKYKWASACLQAGVPEEIVYGFIPKPLQSPSEGAIYPLPNTNHNLEPEPNTTTLTKLSSGESGSGGLESMIYLLPIADPHRGFIESSLRHLNTEDAQMIADEISGALEAAQKGQREPIKGLHAWVPALLSRLQQGSFAPQWGPQVATKRMQQRKATERAAKESIEAQQCTRQQEQDRADAEILLKELREDELTSFSSLIDEHVPMPKMLPRIKESVLRREMPSGVGLVAVIAASKAWKNSPGARP